MDATHSMGRPKYLDWGPGGEDVAVPPDDIASAWYVRADAAADHIRAAFPDVGFLARAGAPAGETAFLTAGSLTRGRLEEKLTGLSPRSVFRVLSD